MPDILKDLCAQKKDLCIYINDSDPSKFRYGHILCVSNDYIAIYMISPGGEYDGIAVVSKDRIIRIDIDKLYDDKMKKLCSLHTLPEFEYELDETDIKKSLLSAAIKSGKLVAIETLDSGYDDIIGFVEEVTDDMCKIKTIDDYGSEYGYSFVKNNNITSIFYDTKKEQRILNLWKLS